MESSDNWLMQTTMTLIASGYVVFAVQVIFFARRIEGALKNARPLILLGTVFFFCQLCGYTAYLLDIGLLLHQISMVILTLVTWAMILNNEAVQLANLLKDSSNVRTYAGERRRSDDGVHSR